VGGHTTYRVLPHWLISWAANCHRYVAYSTIELSSFHSKWLNRRQNNQGSELKQTALTERNQ